MQIVWNKIMIQSNESNGVFFFLKKQKLTKFFFKMRNDNDNELDFTAN